MGLLQMFLPSTDFISSSEKNISQFSHLVIFLMFEFLFKLCKKFSTSRFTKRRKMKYAIGATTPKTTKFILV